MAPSRSGGSSATPTWCLYGLWGTRTAMQSQWNLLSTRPARHSLAAAVQRGHLARPSPDPDGRTAIGPSYITPTHTGKRVYTDLHVFTHSALELCVTTFRPSSFSL